MARLIGTAGHVDHGKTTLIQALTGIDADRLPEEKARGMTIDIGFAYADLPEVGRVSIVDVPGHERFLTNMLVGALGIDVALLVVAADESVMPQTREHFQILELLPVQKMVVAMTRADLADADTREIARAEIEELLEPTRFKGSPILEVSAFTGEGIEALRTELTNAILAPEEIENQKSKIQNPWYLPIDRVFTVKGHGCVVTGTLPQGRVKNGDRAFLEPGHWEVRIRSVQSHGEFSEAGEKGRRTALNLSGVKTEEVHRGMAVGEPGALFETRMFDARVRWIAPAKHGLRVRVSVGAAEAIGKLFLTDADPDLAQLRLESPVACALGQPVIIRRYSPPDVLAGGRVTVPLAKPRRKSEEAAPTIEAGNEAEAILQVLAGAANGVTTEEVCRRLGKSPQSLGPAFEGLLKEKKAFGFAGLWFEPKAFTAAVAKLLEALKALHEEKPMMALQPREKAVDRAGLGWRGKPLDRILAALAAAGRLRVEGTSIALPGHRIALTERQRSFLDRVVESLGQGGANPPSPQELSMQVHAPVQAVEEILRLGVEAGEIARVAEGIFFTFPELNKLKDKARELGAKGHFTAAQFRDFVGTTRKYAIPLLEHFDAIRLTMRVGDARAIVESK